MMLQLNLRRLLTTWGIGRDLSEEHRAALIPGPDVNVAERLKDYISYAEVKRILDRLAEIHSQKGSVSVAVLSQERGEGKTFLTAALALGFSEVMRTRVLVVETTTYSADGSLTLDRALEADQLSPPQDGIHRTLSVNVDLLKLENWRKKDSSGGAEYQIGGLIDRLSSRYGLILFDTSALSARNRKNIDPWVVARRCGSHILVVSRATLRQMGTVGLKEQLAPDANRMVGIVSNSGAIAT